MKLALTKSHMKSISPMRCLAAVAFAGIAAFSAGAADKHWTPQNGSTDISDPSNWGGALPGNGDLMMFRGNDGLSGDYAVRIPAATAENPYQSKAGVFFGNLNDGQTVTIDATGTSWLVMRDDGQPWGYPMRAWLSDHIFDIDSAGDASKPANDFAFSFSNGTMTFKRDSANGSALVFNGDFNMAVAPDGTENAHRTVLFHDVNANSKNSKIIFHSGESTLRSRQFRGKTEGNEFRVDGGRLHVLSGLVINEDSANYTTDAYMHVTGDGQVSVDSGALWIGRNNDGRGVLRIDGNGKFTMTDGTIVTYFPDGAAQTGLLSIGGNGEWNSVKNINVGNNGGTADILVEGNGFFNHSGWFNFGSHNGSHVSLTMKDQARAIVTSAAMVKDAGSGSTRTGVVDLSGDSVLQIASNDQWANSAGSDLTLNMTNNATLKAKKANGERHLIFGNNNGADIKLNLAGGTICDYDGNELIHLQLKGGAQSVYNFSGVTVNTENFIIEGKQDTSAPDAWHIAHQTAGTISVRWHGSGDGLDIRGGNGRNCMYLLEGGTLNVGNMIRVGHNVTDSSKQWRSVFRQTGGQANISANVNMCDSATMAEFELLGGRTRLYSLRGWSQSVARKAGGAWATALFDGGTIEPWANGNTTIYTMPELRLGANGLTFDTLAYDNISIDAKFQNEGEGTDDEAEGLFVKTGTGTLKANMLETNGLYVDRDIRSYHSRTRIDQGKLILTKAADVAFGKNITVKGGATLSLEGTAATLTVDTITLGDGHGFAVLKLDAGDTVVVEAANGVTANCGAIDVPWKSTDGNHAVFTCKQSVQVGELDKIAVHDGDATKDYAWTTEVDNDTGYTICSVTVAPKGTLTKTITYSSGAVTTNGTGKVSGIIAEETGTQSGELVLSSTASVSVDADQTMTLNGPLVGTGVELKKTGSGKLVVDGSNPDFYGSFASGGGAFEVLSAAGFGANPVNFPLVLGGGTLRYTGSGEVVFDAALRIAAGAKKQQVILDNEGDMTFKSTEYVQGGFVKTGVGTLTFALPAGKFALGSGDSSEDIGANAGQVSLPANGDSPTSNDGLYGVTVLEGMLKVVGEGRDVTTLETRNRALLGGGYPAETAAKLVVENARVNWGAGSRTATFCHDVPADRPSPEICLTNAMLWSDSPMLGYYAYGNNAMVKLSMKDSEYYGHYNSRVGSGTVGVMVDADNSQMHSDGQVGWAINAKTIQADFHGADAEFGSFDKTQTADNSNGGRFVAAGNTTGLIQLREGARMKTTRGIVFNNSEIAVVFDGGIFEIVPHNTLLNTTSTWTNVQGGFTTQGSGLTVDICEGSTHALNFPVKGTGKVVKTGEGTFELVSARAEGEKLLQYTGGTVVSNGTFVIDGSLVADGAKSFEVAEGAILDLNETTLEGATIAGAGVVTNGTLSAATIAYGEDALPTFTDVTFDGTLTVDFDKTDEDTLDKTAAKAGIVVARYTGEAPANLRVKSVNTGIERVRTAVVCEGGDVIAKMTQSGFSVVIR